MKRTTVICMILLSLLLSPWTATLLAQDEEPVETPGAKKGEELALTAEFMKKKLEDLLMNMSEVARLMESTEPEVAKILRRTVDHAQRELVSDKMGEVVRLLRKGLDEAAQKNQSEVIAKLTTMLRILEGVAKEESELDKQIAERKAVQEEMQRQLDRQKQLENQSRAAAHAKEIDQEMKRITKALEDIAKQQEALKKQTAEAKEADPHLKKLGDLRSAIREQIEKQQTLAKAAAKAPPSKLPLLGEAQKKLAEESGKLQDQLNQAGEDKGLQKALAQAGAKADAVSQAGKHVQSATDEMKRAGKALDDSRQDRADIPQRQALTDLKNAEKALTNAMKQMADKSASGKLSQQQNKLSQETSTLANDLDAVAKKAGIDPESLKGSGKKDAPKGDLNKAAGHMDKAADEITGQKNASAGEQQQKALDELKEQLLKAEELHRLAMKKAQEKLNAAEQKNIADKTGSLADRMKKDQTGKPMAGQQSASDAGKSASAAAGKIDESDSSGANQQQKKAVEQMQDALDQLEEEIAELERRSKDEKLTRVEERLEKILDQQKEYTRLTQKTWTTRNMSEPVYDRGAEQDLAKLSKGEGVLSNDVETIRKLLLKEGTTVVFPEVLKDVRDDLKDVEKRLTEKDPGPLTQATQEEIEQALQELLDAVRKELSKNPGRKKGGGGGAPGGGGGKKQPLIPPIAELRMLRLQQLRVNHGTVRLDKMVSDKQITPEQSRQQGAKLAERQQHVVKLAEQMKAKLQTPRVETKTP